MSLHLKKFFQREDRATHFSLSKGLKRKDRGSNMKKRTLILTGGTLHEAFVKQFMEKEAFDCIICADKGLMIADALQLEVDYIVGDFDSVEEKVIAKYKREKKAVIKEFKPEKDLTDTHISILLALEESAEEIVILGATGTRLDHVLANIYLLLEPLKREVKAAMIDAHNKIYLCNKEQVLYQQELYGSYVSLLPLTEKVEGVTLKGFQYPLDKKDLTIGDSLGISNEVIEEQAYITCETGTLIVIEARD